MERPHHCAVLPNRSHGGVLPDLASLAPGGPQRRSGRAVLRDLHSARDQPHQAGGERMHMLHADRKIA